MIDPSRQEVPASGMTEVTVYKYLVWGEKRTRPYRALRYATREAIAGLESGSSADPPK
jgi:hypothetical protein